MATWKRDNPVVLHDGVPYWVAFAAYIDFDHPFDSSGDSMKILDLGHAVGSTNTHSLHALQLLPAADCGSWSSVESCPGWEKRHGGAQNLRISGDQTRVVHLRLSVQV